VLIPLRLFPLYSVFFPPLSSPSLSHPLPPLSLSLSLSPVLACSSLSRTSLFYCAKPPWHTRLRRAFLHCRRSTKSCTLDSFGLLVYSSRNRSNGSGQSAALSTLSTVEYRDESLWRKSMNVPPFSRPVRARLAQVAPKRTILRLLRARFSRTC